DDLAIELRLVDEVDDAEPVAAIDAVLRPHAAPVVDVELTGAAAGARTHHDNVGRGIAIDVARGDVGGEVHTGRRAVERDVGLRQRARGERRRAPDQVDGAGIGTI